MSYQKIPLLAGKPYQVDIAGTLFLMDTPGVALGVDVALVRNGTPAAIMPNRKAAFRHVGAFDGVMLTSSVDTTVGFFISFDDVQLGVNDGSNVAVPGGVAITNPVGNPIPVTFSQQIVPLGSVEVSNSDAKAIPVVQKAGASFAATVTNNVATTGVITNTVSTTGVITNSDAQAVPVAQKAGTVFATQAEKLTNIVDHAPAVINNGAAQLLINDATYKRLRVKNASASARVAIGGAAVTMANAAIILEPGDVWVEDDAAGASWYAVSDTAATDVRVMGVK